MTSIDTKVLGDPAACDAAAAQLTTLKSALEKTADDVIAAPRELSAAWEGDAADAFADQSKKTTKNLDTLADQVGQIQTALSAFATTLRDVKKEMADLRTQAQKDSLTLTPDAIVPPLEPAADADATAVTAYNTTVTAYNKLVPTADAQRLREQKAHTALGDSLEKAKGIPRALWFLDKAGIIPPDHGDTVQNTVYTMGMAGNLASWAATWAAKTHVTRFAPRWPAGSTLGTPGAFRPHSGLSAWEAFQLASDDAAWVAKPGMKGATKAWGAVDDITGKAGVAFAAFSGGYDQYKKDEDDTSLSGAAKTARVTASAATTGVGAWAGAEIGGQAGAGIGFLVGGPPGAAVGAVVGGVVGGFAGTQVGQWAGDQISDKAGEVGDAAWDAAKNVGSAVSDKARDAGGWLKDHNPFGGR